MSVAIEGRVIRGLDLNADSFRARWKDLPANVQDEGYATIKELLFQNVDQLPDKLHFHQLKNKQVPSRLDPKKKVNSWSMHITADDRHKASFTFEDGILYFRTCGKHDEVDKKP